MPLTAVLLGTMLIGCQLLCPYKGPITPTPYQWKTTYSAPDAGQPAVPMVWKEDISTQPSNPSDDPSPFENKNLSTSNAESPPITSLTETLANASPETQPETEIQGPLVEDVCRDLYNWWEIFQDPILNQLEEQALASSYTLWAALERVLEARATARINFSPLLPAVNFDPSFLRFGALIQNPLTGIGGSAQPASAAAAGSISSMSDAANATTAAAATNAISNIPNVFRIVQTDYLVPLTMSYEVDLWSQLHNNYYASFIRAQASSQAYLSILLSLTADVASAYFQIRGLDAQQEVLQRNIAVRQNAVDINQARFDAGLIVYLDVSRAQVELARAHSDSADVRRLRGLQENLLATLVGTPASVFSIEYNPVIYPPPVIPRGIPSELLCRRPDIAEAERNLAAAYRDIGVAYANFFPSLTLNAAFGFESPFTHELFSWQSRFWLVGWNVMQTVFDAGRNEANLNYYKARFWEAMANYQEQVLQSFRDVEDSLVNLREYANRAQDLAVAVRAAHVTLELAQLRYNRGLINYLDVVDAERQLLETEQNAVIVLENRYTSTVMLIRSLGGGWGPCDSCSESDENDG
jgi:multidrug efflux system outer membrane protein